MYQIYKIIPLLGSNFTKILMKKHDVNHDLFIYNNLRRFFFCETYCKNKLIVK